ncbi:10237_t:CDS:2, partial [Funneliformis caledonium]
TSDNRRNPGSKDLQNMIEQPPFPSETVWQMALTSTIASSLKIPIGFGKRKRFGSEYKNLLVGQGVSLT